MVAAWLCFGVLSSAFAQEIIINEISSAQNNRLLQRPPGAPPRLGNLPAWHELDFAVPSFWQSAPGPHGFGYTQATNVRGAMVNKTPSLYLRRSFSATAVQATSDAQLELIIDYDYGFVAYLNGVEVARRNTGAIGSYTWHDQPAFNVQMNAGAPETIPLGAASSLLREGANVLAIQVHNMSVKNERLFCSATLHIASATPQLLVIPEHTWDWFAGISPPSGGLYDPADFTTGEELANPKFLDWIELKNTGTSVVELGGWTLTDSTSKPAKWTFPAGVKIPAGGYLVVACSGRDIKAPANGGLLHTNFSLSAKGEYLALRDAAGVLQSEILEMPPQNAFHTWGLAAGTNQYRFLPRGTPGMANVEGSAVAIAAEVVFDKPTGFHSAPLSIALSSATPGASIRYTLDGSEPSETSTLYAGPFDPMPLPSDESAAGTILREVFQWPTGTTVLPPDLPENATPTFSQLISQFEAPMHVGDYYTQRVRGFVRPPQTGIYEFWLATDNDGELWLSTDRNPANKRKIAYITGWVPPREWTAQASGKSEPIHLVGGRRYYIEALQSETDGGDHLSVGWSGPGLPEGITLLEGRYLSPPAPLPPGNIPPVTITPPGATVRARAFAPGHLPSEVGTRNYITGHDPRLATVPAIFLNGPAEEAFYAPDGIFAQVGGGWPSGTWVVEDPRFDYNFAMMRGRAFERPVALEVINPSNQLVERTNIGARFAGSSWSRPQYQLKEIADTEWNHGAHYKPQLNLFFRSDFGISQLEKKGFIPTSTLRKWDTLRLRAGKHDPYNPFIVDEWMRRSFASMGAPAPQGFIATLFINGQFKSYFNPTERTKSSFFQQFYGSSNLFDVNNSGDWEDGDAVVYDQMLSFFQDNDFTSASIYEQGAAMWDMSNVADYIIINGWAATHDWPTNNYAFFRERAPGARWRFSMWDAEGGIGRFGQSITHNTFESELHISSMSSPEAEGLVALVFRRAHQNTEFRMLFADRLQKHFFNGGVMSRMHMNARWNSLRGEMEPLTEAVFGGSFDNDVWDKWANRDSTFLSQAHSVGLWPLTVAPSMTPFGGTLSAGSTVTLGNPNAEGTIYFTTTGADPRAVGGAAQGSIYTEPIALSSRVTLKARIRSASGEWSPLVEASFVPALPRIVITELHYNPPGAGDATEFLELTNVSNQPVALQGMHFTKGITFTFGDITLAPGANVVLVKDAAAFAATYPGVPIGGVFTGSLDNSGETITLCDITGAVILSFTYGNSDAPGWPSAPDGGGMTLVLRRPFHPDTDPNSPASWRSSTVVGGTPGEADSTLFSGDPAADADGDGYSALVEYALGTSDASAASQPEITMTLEPSGALRLSVLHPVAADDVVLEALESTDLATWTLAPLLQQVPSSNSAYLQSTWESQQTGDRVFMRLRIRQD